MKIEKLYTLSQFIDLQELIRVDETGIIKPSDITSKNVDKWTTTAVHAYGRIQKYNEFLKQPIKKEMFMNEYKCAIPFETSTDKDLWCASEKKVLFKGMSKRNYDNGIVIDCDYLDMFFDLTEYETLHDLAEETNGELELKNVEI